MPSKLITTWSDYESAVEETLASATHSLRIFDENLSALKLERSGLIATLRRFLNTSPGHSLQIIIQHTDHLLNHSPRLMELLITYAHNFQIYECPPHLQALSDAMILADGKFGVVRFYKSQARAKVIFDDIKECAPYKRRYDQILEEGGILVTGRALGL